MERKASGISLIQELRKGGLPVKPMLPDRSKKSRAHAAEISFEQGCVWYMDRAWAQPVIRECAQFPNGERHTTWSSVTRTTRTRKSHNLSANRFMVSYEDSYAVSEARHPAQQDHLCSRFEL